MRKCGQKFLAQVIEFGISKAGISISTCMHVLQSIPQPNYHWTALKAPVSDGPLFDMYVIAHIKGLNLAVPHNVCPHPRLSLNYDIVLNLDAFGPESTAGRRVRVLCVVLQRDSR